MSYVIVDKNNCTVLDAPMFFLEHRAEDYITSHADILPADVRVVSEEELAALVQD